MSNEVWIGKKGFRYWYYKFRDSEYYSLSIIGVTIFVCLMLLIFWIIPELNNWFSIRNEVIATRQKIAVLQQNINFMNNLDKNTLDEQLQTSTQALPSEKNFGGMLDAISVALINSGVSLSDYSFEIGTLGTPPSTLGTTPGTPVVASLPSPNGLSSVEITVVVSGTIGQVRRFIQSLEENLPLSEVTMINGGGGNVSVTIQFFQKPFPISTFSADTPLTPLSEQKVELLQKLSKWQTSTGGQTQVSQTSSGSAIPLF